MFINQDYIFVKQIYPKVFEGNNILIHNKKSFEIIKMYYLYRNHDFYGFISFKDPSITHIVNQFYNSINLYSIDNELIVNSKLLGVNTMVKNNFFLI